MLPGSRRQLGLVFTPTRVAIALVRGNGKARLLASAVVRLDKQINLENPQELGQKLRQELRRLNVRATSAAIGLPARWVMTRHKPVPPHAGNTLAPMLRLAADRSFATDARELVIDFVPPVTASSAASAESAQQSPAIAGVTNAAAASDRQVLLVAALRKRIEQVTAAVQATGLKPAAIMPSAMAMSACLMPEGAGDAALLLIDGDGVEWCAAQHGRTTTLRHLNVEHGDEAGAGDGKAATGHGPAFIDAVARTLLTEQAGESRGNDVLVVSGLAADDAATLGQRLGVTTTVAQVVAQPQAMEQFAAPTQADAHAERALEQAAAAVALAHDAARDRTVDFLHSRLAEPRRRMLNGRWRAALLAGAAALLAVGAPLWFQHVRQARVDQLQEQVSTMQAEVKAAKETVQRVRHAEQWFGNRPRALEPLLALTLSFPQTGDIWATDVTFREDATIVVTGKATDQRHILELHDRLQRSEAIDSVKLLYMRSAGGERRELTYSIALRYRGTAAAPDDTQGALTSRQPTADAAARP